MVRKHSLGGRFLFRRLLVHIHHLDTHLFFGTQLGVCLKLPEEGVAFSGKGVERVEGSGRGVLCGSGRGEEGNEG